MSDQIIIDGPGEYLCRDGLTAVITGRWNISNNYNWAGYRLYLDPGGAIPRKSSEFGWCANGSFSSLSVQGKDYLNEANGDIVSKKHISLPITLETESRGRYFADI